MNPKVIELSLEIQDQIEEIAKRNLHVETLHVRHQDRLDFYDLAIWNIRNALVEAYTLGQKNVKHHD